MLPDKEIVDISEQVASIRNLIEQGPNELSRLRNFLQGKTRRIPLASLGKSFDTFAPLGPAIVTKDEVPDPHALEIRLSIGGEILQRSNTRELIFRAPGLIAYLSAITPLEPGDIISTGTPAGVGLGRTPYRWLCPGETIVIEVEGLGPVN